VLAGCLAAGPAGCTTAGVEGLVEARSLGPDPVTLRSKFSESVYHHQPEHETSFLLADVAIEDLAAGRVRSGRVLHLELLWVPKPGATPLDSTATNASIRFVVFVEGEMGIYEGGGFAELGAALGADSLTITLSDATVRLSESTEGFRDLLSPARMTGRFAARHDPRRTRAIHFVTSQIVTDVLGRSVLVMGEAGAP
jgi:hypothetical protein